MSTVGERADFPQELIDLFQLYVHGEIDRGAFPNGAAKFAVRRPYCRAGDGSAR
jgi:hypothetical protein